SSDLSPELPLADFIKCIAAKRARNRGFVVGNIQVIFVYKALNCRLLIRFVFFSCAICRRFSEKKIGALFADQRREVYRGIYQFALVFRQAIMHPLENIVMFSYEKTLVFAVSFNSF